MTGIFSLLTVCGMSEEVYFDDWNLLIAHGMWDE